MYQIKEALNGGNECLALSESTMVGDAALPAEGQPKSSSAGRDPTLLNENDNKGTRRAASVLPLSPFPE